MYLYLSFPVLFDLVDLLVVVLLTSGIARGERRDHYCLYGGFRIVVVRGRRSLVVGELFYWRNVGVLLTRLKSQVA